MPIYISEVTLTQEGLSDMATVADRIAANHRLWEDAGGKLLSWYVGWIVCGAQEMCVAAGGSLADIWSRSLSVGPQWLEAHRRSPAGLATPRRSAI